MAGMSCCVCSIDCAWQSCFWK